MTNFEVEVLVNNRPVHQFHHKGQIFIEGRKGSEFELKITNNSYRNAEVVPSVDGLSVIDGKPCGTGSKGYIVYSHDSIIIPGWRLDDDNVANFIFQDENRSYSNQTGHGTSNTGSIGFMIFNEMVSAYIPQLPIDPNPFPHPLPIYPPNPFPHPNPWPVRPPYKGNIWVSGRIDNTGNWQTQGGNTITSSNRKGLGSISTSGTNSITSTSGDVSLNSQSADQFGLGTGFGDEAEHRVSEVDFIRHNQFNPNKLITLYYDSRKGLELRGIKVVKSRKKNTTKLPNPFPNYTESGCTPPRNWRR